MTANRGYQSIDNFILSGRPFSFFHFKGTPSQKEHKTILNIFTTIESASTGQVGLLQSSELPQYGPRCSPYSYRTVQRGPLPYIILCCMAPIKGSTASPYSHFMVQGQDRTVALRCRRGTIRQFDRFMMTKFALVPDFKIVSTRTQAIIFYLFD